MYGSSGHFEIFSFNTGLSAGQLDIKFVKLVIILPRLFIIAGCKHILASRTFTLAHTL
jgi:hypothetical protein